MAGNSEILYIIPQVSAYHIQDGVESELNGSGPQSLELSRLEERDDRSGEWDTFLQISLPPELTLRIPATTRVFLQPPRSYLIAPHTSGGSDSGAAFIKLELPQLGRGIQQDDVDTFESILAAYTSFMERARTNPKGSLSSSEKGAQQPPAYNPAAFKQGEAYAYGTGNTEGGQHGHVVLIDNDNGSVVGELAEDETPVDDSAVKPGEKDPVEISFSPDGKKIIVKPVSEDYLSMARMPAYQNSSIVQNAAAASRLIVTTSDFIANKLSAGAESFTAKTQPQKPIIFNPSTHQRVRKINDLTASAKDLSSRTVGQAAKLAQNVGATLSRRKDKQRARQGADGEGVDEDYKPGLLNKSMIAFSTLVDGIAYGGKHLLDTGGSAATSVVGHRYGDDARQVAAGLTSSVTNVGLVYIDVTGVSRRAVIKSVAKGMLVGKVKGGGKVIVGEGDGGDIPENIQAGESVGPGGEPPKYTPGDYKGEYKPFGGSEKYL